MSDRKTEEHKKTEFEEGFEIILNTFRRYAARDEGGCADKLEKKEMKALIQDQFQDYLALSDNTSVDEIFQKFDEDKSESVDFVEFLKIVAQVAADADILNKIN